jgi:hypothetical protein
MKFKNIGAIKSSAYFKLGGYIYPAGRVGDTKP